MTGHRREKYVALGAICAACALLIPTTFAAETEGASVGPCAPAGSRTLATDGRARVYSVPLGSGAGSVRVFGCMFATAKPVSLGTTSLAADAATIEPRTVALTSPWAAYSLSEQGSVFGEVYVALKNLRTGKAKRKADAGLDQLGPGKSSAVTDIVVSAAGAVAWIVTGSAEGPPRQAREIVAIDSTGVRRTLDAAADIDPHSLVLRRHRLSWTDGGVRHSAALP
jgi:hypothetical protein